MPLVDKIIIGILCLFFLSGWLRGFLKSLIGPISFFCCFISAVIFYDLNYNILIAVVITTLGTLIMVITLHVLLSLTLANVNTEFRGKTSLPSRFLGGFINLFWQGNIFFAFLIVFSTLPISNEKLENLQKHLLESHLIAYYSNAVINRDNHLKAIVATLSIMRNPNEMQKICSSKEFEQFKTNSKTKKFLNDPQVIDAFVAKDSLRLLQNSSFIELITDDGAMYSLTKAVKTVYQKKLQDLEGPAEK